MSNPLIRDCYQQVKTIHRLLLILQDDLGDAALNNPELRARLEDFSDKCNNAEVMFQGMREKLDKLSRQ